MTKSYDYTALALHGASGAFFGVNDKGTSVGIVVKSGTVYGLIDDNGQVSKLRVDGSDQTALVGVNSSGTVIGSYTTPPKSGPVPDLISFMDDDGKISKIAVEKAKTTYANGINNAGEVVGYYITHQGDARGFTLINGDYKQVEYAKVGNTYIDGVSKSGALIGSYSSQKTRLSFIDIGGKFTPLDVPCSSSTDVTAISQNGTVLGSYDDSTGSHEYIYRNGKYTEIALPSQFSSSSLGGINNAGNVVGYGYGGKSNQRAITGTPGNGAAVRSQLATALFDAALAPSGGVDAHGAQKGDTASPALAASHMLSHTIGH